MYERMEDYYRQKWEREHPPEPQPAQPENTRAHLHTAGPALLIPGGLAMVTGFFLALAAAVIAYYTKWAPPMAAFLITWVTVQAIAWLALLYRWLDLTRPIERALNLDLNRDGYIGEPTKPEPIRIEVSQNDGGQLQFADLPGPIEKLTQMSEALQRGATFSEGQWTGQGALFSRAQFRVLRDEFLRRGWLVWTNPEARGQGLQLTHAGNAVVRHFASMAPKPPTLRKNDP